MTETRRTKTPLHAGPGPQKPARGEDAARRAEALRANLRRRKAQARARQAEDGMDSGG